MIDGFGGRRVVCMALIVAIALLIQYGARSLRR
jgi:hypothetical protein